MGSKIPELFNYHEKSLRDKIDSSDKPFIGLFADFFKDVTKNELIKIIHNFSNPVDDYIKNIKSYPALLATLITVEVLENFGKSGFFEVYPYIEKLFDTNLTQPQKQRLWSAYRQACLGLGLSVSPRTSGSHYIVGEFLRQSGLPLEFADKFCKKAITCANRVGMPDQDNPEEIKQWQLELIKTLTLPFPKSAKQAIERDENCYYSRLFIRLLVSANIDNKILSKLEQRLLQTIVEGPKIAAKRARIPYVVIRDFEYGILLPSGEKDEWHIQSKGDETEYIISTYTTYGEDRFIPFDNATLPSEVIIKNSNGVLWKYSLWEGIENNRLLIFSLPLGKLVKSATLKDKQIDIEPGEYLLMLRFEPNDDGEVEGFCEEPTLFLKRVFLSPGESITLTKGPVTLDLKADLMPVICWETKPLKGTRGNELYPGSDLKLKIIIPDELKNVEQDAQELSLLIKSPTLGDEIKIILPFFENNSMVLDLTHHLKKWKPGVARVLFELKRTRKNALLRDDLRREDSGRTIARNSVIVWNGLKYIDKYSRFYCENLPANIDPDRCENLSEPKDNKNIFYSYKDDTNRFFKFCFTDRNRNLEFSWKVPGIFLSIVDYAEHSKIEKTIRIGSTISVNITSRKVLKIYATEFAFLHLGDWETDVNFERIGVKTISLAGLIDHIGTENNTLYMRTRNLSYDLEALPLIHVVSPFTAKQFHYIKQQEGKKIEICLSDKIEGIRIVAENLLDELDSTNPIQYQVEFQNQISDTADFNQVLQQQLMMQQIPIQCFFSAENNDLDNKIILYIPTIGWSSGLWIMHFYIKAAGRWGKLTNENNQLYADGWHSGNPFDQINQLFDEKTLYEVNDNQDKYAAKNNQDIIVSVFERIHNVLIPRYAPESWNQILFLERLSKHICKEHLSKLMDSGNIDSAIVTRLLHLATEYPDEYIKEGEIPALNLGAIIPKIFCLNRTFYSIKGEISNSTLSVLKFMHRLANLKQVFSDGDIELSALFGFSNAIQLANNQADIPENFSFKSYDNALTVFDCRNFELKEHLLDDQWIPGRGDFLGPMHYRYALLNFKQTFRTNIAINSLMCNEVVGKVLAVVKKFTSKSIRNYCNCNLPDTIINKSNLDLFDKQDFNENLLTDDEKVEREHFLNIINFISLFAKVCRIESRYPGTFNSFMDDYNIFLTSDCNHGLNKSDTANRVLGYILFVGDALFAFYLLLWELIITADS